MAAALVELVGWPFTGIALGIVESLQSGSLAEVTEADR
jgi:hypothetical protein